MSEPERGQIDGSANAPLQKQREGIIGDASGQAELLEVIAKLRKSLADAERRHAEELGRLTKSEQMQRDLATETMERLARATAELAAAKAREAVCKEALETAAVVGEIKFETNALAQGAKERIETALRALSSAPDAQGMRDRIRRAAPGMIEEILLMTRPPVPKDSEGLQDFMADAEQALTNRILAVIAYPSAPRDG